jgi:hypothetical protein
MINNQFIIYIKHMIFKYIVQSLKAVRRTTDFYCKNNMKHENAFCEQNLSLLNTKADLFDITTVLQRSINYVNSCYFAL